MSSTLSNQAQISLGRKGKLGIILYTIPSSPHYHFGLRLAKAALDGGHEVRMFAWADSVYAVASSKFPGDVSGAETELASLLKKVNSSGQNRFSLDVCTSCFKMRGLLESNLIPGAHLSGLHKIVEIIRTCDKTLAMIP
jgi:sulfur relay (sulfurtransferase) complex TusBCD TusD component (DsrE family)